MAATNADFTTTEGATLTYKVPSAVPSEDPEIIKAFIRQAALHADVDRTTVNFVHEASHEAGRNEVSLQIPPKSDINDVHKKYQEELVKQATPSSTVQGKAEVVSPPVQEKNR